MDNPRIVGKWGKLATVDVQIAVNPDGLVVASYEIPESLENGSSGANPLYFGTVLFKCNDTYCERVDDQGRTTGMPVRIVEESGALRLQNIFPPSAPSVVESCEGFPVFPDDKDVLRPIEGGFRITQSYWSSTGSGCGYGVAFIYDIVLTKVG